ncbi:MULTISPECIES: hypothetical protein [Xanthomonas]|uniref:Uncharacterized protein n=2 Tax=Xanthomonas TaxID=338 RepID=A0AA44Z075_XANCM|nr:MULTISPECIES: hypothetical protein [Xanthomonas]OOW62682.1 hypothetical protein Xths_14705 [Xanthomonas campestris pv. thespesiae]OOW77348.1 hypothetical protein Xvtw_05335 [Xanthomonas campestris pv. vitiswoodrowii]OOW80232.1 hypothetical protein Xlen_11725 [Xanthomonas campestris pv. leeana]OOW87795.1 hypothetical protein Xvtf_14405 [Xanthomonas campestris pv. vitistrifoliae]OOW89576.1 hypothetical protein Xvtr_20160 [Xanthomonas campestris pv. vitiscarnosae]CEJ46864.1 conserved hypothet
MVTKTPSSLKWLVDKRARLAGHIAQIQRRADAARQLAADLDSSVEATRRDLEALDRILGLHDICVPPEVIRPVRMSSEGPLLQRGHISRNVLACLREAAGEWRSTTEVLLFVGSQGKAVDGNVQYAELRLRVRKCLQAHCSAGRVIRRNSPRTNVEGYWALAPDADDGGMP